MPRLKGSVPKYRKHRASGQAVVTIAGRDHYLGPWKSKTSVAEYDRLIGEWLAAGRPSLLPAVSESITVTELIAAYWEFAKQYYRKDGKPSGSLCGIRVALRLLRDSYGHTLVDDFGPLAVQALQEKMVKLGQGRRYLNDNIERIRRCFRWGVTRELVPVSVYEAIRAVPGLRKGRTDAPDYPPIQPVTPETVEATLRFLPPIVSDMVRIQQLSGCRPGEVCMLRPRDVETDGDLWLYRPASHKTQHHGRERIILLGPRAQEVLRRYLDRGPNDFCFSPRESERVRLVRIHAERVTPLSCGNRPGTNRRSAPKRSAGDCYTNNSYRQAIHRACDLAFPPPTPLACQSGESDNRRRARLDESQLRELSEWQHRHRWSPNQLRHTTATEIRKQFGLEAAQVTLGHATASVTQIYAERDLQKAAEIMRQIG